MTCMCYFKSQLETVSHPTVSTFVCHSALECPSSVPPFFISPSSFALPLPQAIVDTGKTMKALLKHVETFEPKMVKVAGWASRSVLCVVPTTRGNAERVTRARGRYHSSTVSICCYCSLQHHRHQIFFWYMSHVECRSPLLLHL